MPKIKFKLQDPKFFTNPSDIILPSDFQMATDCFRDDSLLESIKSERFPDKQLIFSTPPSMHRQIRRVIMKVLVACEESQAVTKEFRKLGHEAYSCDILPCSGGHPEWHLQQDVLPLLKEKWDMIIAFPPCTHLAVSGARWFEQKIKDGRQKKGIDFFMHFANAKCRKIAIENPIGIISKIWRKPDQIIQPWQFGDSFQKSTCLWIKGLPLLKATKIVSKGEFITHKSGKTKPKWYADAFRLPPTERAKARSKTFAGIAKAMAEQWGGIL